MIRHTMPHLSHGNLRVALAGQENAGLQTLRLLTDAGCDVVTVLADPEARGRGLTDSARAAGITVLPASTVREPSLADDLRRDGVDVLLNVHSLYLVHRDVLAAPRLGSFNLHPGPLPECAGLDAPSWAILHGHRRHAATLHWMEPGIDTGAVAFTAGFGVADDDTGATLAGRSVRMGLPLVSELVSRLQVGLSVPAVAQDLSRRRCYGRRRPGESAVDWAGPARDVVALVRACDYSPWRSPWGPATTGTTDGRRIDVLRASTTGRVADEPPGTVATAATDAVLVAAADEWVRVSRLRVEGHRVVPGVALRPGDRLVTPAPLTTLRTGASA